MRGPLSYLPHALVRLSCVTKQHYITGTNQLPLQCSCHDGRV